MAENLGASFSIDVTNLKAGLKQANKLIRESESEFKAAAAGMDNWSKSEEGLTKKLKSLNDITAIQQQKVDALKAEYKKLIDNGLDPTSTKAIDLRTQINKETEALNKNKSEAEKTQKALDDLGNETEDTAKKAKNAAGTDGKSGFGAMDVMLGNLAATITTKALGALKDLGGAVADAYSEFDKGGDEVIKATGATGEVAAELRQSYANVSKQIVADSSAIGRALGEVNTRFGFTGKELEDATLSFLKFSDVTGEDAKTAVAKVSQMMQKAGISTQSYSKILDMLYSASANGGISISKLTENLTKYGTQLKNMGFDTETSIALFTELERSGVNTEQMFTGLQKASANWLKEGKDTREEFEKLIDDIKKSPTSTAAGQRAVEVLGNKAGPEFAEAVRKGEFEYNNFVKLVQDSGGKLNAVFDETLSATDEVKLAFQGLKTDVGKAVDDMTRENKGYINDFIDFIKGALKWLPIIYDGIVSAITETLLWFEDRIRDIKNAIKGFFDFWEGFGEYLAGEADPDANSDTQWGRIKQQGYEDAAYKARLAAGLGQTGKKNYLMATGGIVRQATNAIIGENGAEAVIPLEKNTGWIDLLAQKLGGKMRGVTVNQTNNYAAAHSRYEIFMSQQATAKAVKLALKG